MIQIYFKEDDGRLTVDIKGHGDLENIQGLDVMCAATTTLADTLGLNIQSAEQCGMLEGEPTVYVGDDGEGIARLEALPKPEYYNIVKTMFVTVTTGFLFLSQMYPEYVQYGAEVFG